jgi:putative ABC transport system substrate-binding protein
MIRRRTFLAGMASAIVTPSAAAGQQGRVYRVGVILQGGPYSAAIDGLRQGLRESGLAEQKDFVLDVRNAKGDLRSIATAARALEQEKIDVVYSVATSVTLAVKEATKHVPIVFYVGSDPVTFGLVANFRKPGGRLTGIYSGFTELTAKRVELLREMLPKARRVVTFYDPANSSALESLKVAREATRRFDIELVERPVASVEELQAALRAVRSGEFDAYVAVSDAMVAGQQELIITTAAAKRLPTVLQEHESVAKGGLASYGVSYYAVGRLSAKHINRVLLGADPGSLPVERLDRLHYVINLKTAKALGMSIPQAVVLRADEVIE